MGRVFDATVEWCELAGVPARTLLARDARFNRDALENISDDRFRNGDASGSLASIASNAPTSSPPRGSLEERASPIRPLAPSGDQTNPTPETMGTTPETPAEAATNISQIPDTS